MLWWLETQETLVIALVIFAFCYLLAAATLIIAAVLSKLPIAGGVGATTPAMLTPLGVVTGLVIAFLAARVWSNVDHAQGYVSEEASAIREVVLIAESLPPEAKAAVRQEIAEYLRFVDAEDWPAMLQRRVSLQRLPPGLSDALTTLLSIDVERSGQRLAQQQATAAVQRALAARRNRILLSEAVISIEQWIVIFVLDGLILLTIANLHVGRHDTTIINMLVFQTAIACCVVLLMINDRPFNAGGVAIQPTALHQIRP